MKIALRSWPLTMVESKARKGVFLQEVVRSLGLSGADVVTSRIEAVGAHVLEAAAVTLRAVRLSDELLAHVTALLVDGGALLRFESSPNAEQLAGFAVAASQHLLGASWLHVYRLAQTHVPRGTS